MRALLLASALPQNTTPERFWSLFSSEQRSLAGLHVYDPFMGGGSTLVEAARLGAQPSGGDIDPVAVRVVRRELAPADAVAIRKASDELLLTLRTELGALYPTSSGTPLHYFSIAEVTCPSCSAVGPLYRDLVLVRDTGKHGAVVREAALTVFCPTCFALHHLPSADRVRLRCCGRYYDIHTGTFRSQRYHCPNCRSVATHAELKTGTAPRRLVAVEEVVSGARRQLRTPHTDEIGTIESAETEWEVARERLPRPLGRVRVSRRDERPLSYGIEHYEQMFTHRQLLVFGRAFQWIQESGLPEEVRDSLELAVSNALATNNRLCGYATDYGRLAPLFFIRGFSLPSLAVELNPLIEKGGRGTLSACIDRAIKSSGEAVRRHVWDPNVQQPVAKNFEFIRNGTPTRIQAQDAAAPVLKHERDTIDIAVFDPPYFDFIAYDELSEFHRAWLGHPDLAGEPLLPAGDDPVQSFGVRLGQALRSISQRVRQQRPLCFTYHATKEPAWQAIGVALDQADLRITAMWPVRSDGHMGHHSRPGNSEWDVVIVCRRKKETTARALSTSEDQWVQAMSPLAVSTVDQDNFRYALAMARDRFAGARGAARK